MKNKINISEELTTKNLEKFVSGLNKLISSSRGITSLATSKFVENLRIMESLSMFISKQNRNAFNKSMLVHILSVREYLDFVMQLNEMKPYLAKLLKIKSNLDRFVSKSSFSIPEDNSDVCMDKGLESKTREELYEHYSNMEIQRIMKYYSDREKEKIKKQAEQDIETFILSHGMVKPTPRRSLEEELQLAIKEAHASIMERTNYIIKLNEEPTEREELTDSQKLEKYLGEVSDFVIESEKKKRKI